MELVVNKSEISIMLDWYEYANSDSYHFGGPDIIIPVEGMLVRKLQECTDTLTLNDREVGLIAEWMRTTVHQRYGSAPIFFGFEGAVYEKIQGALNRD